MFAIFSSRSEDTLRRGDNDVEDPWIMTVKGPSGGGSSSSLDSLSSTCSTSSFIPGHPSSQPNSLSISVNNDYDDDEEIEEEENEEDSVDNRLQSEQNQNHIEDRMSMGDHLPSSPVRHHHHQNSSNHHYIQQPVPQPKEEPKPSNAFSSNLSKFQQQAQKDQQQHQQQINFQRNRSLSPPPPPPTKPSHGHSGQGQQAQSPTGPVFRNQMHVQNSPVVENNNVVGYPASGNARKEKRESPDKSSMTMSPTGIAAMGGGNMKDKYPPINKVLPTPKQGSPVREGGSGMTKGASGNHVSPGTSNSTSNGVGSSALTSILNEVCTQVLSQRVFEVLQRVCNIFYFIFSDL